MRARPPLIERATIGNRRAAQLPCEDLRLRRVFAGGLRGQAHSLGLPPLRA